MIRALLRRWLGIHDDATIRAAILAEIDADAVWRAGAKETDSLATSQIDRRAALANERRWAIRLGNREEPGV